MLDGVAKIKIIHCTCINNTIPMIQRVLIFTSFLLCPKKKKHEEQLLTSIFYYFLLKNQEKEQRFLLLFVYANI